MRKILATAAGCPVSTLGRRHHFLGATLGRLPVGAPWRIGPRAVHKAVVSYERFKSLKASDAPFVELNEDDSYVKTGDPVEEIREAEAAAANQNRGRPGRPTAGLDDLGPAASLGDGDANRKGAER